eukprot:2205573-Amphidinium_carterae.1
MKMTLLIQNMQGDNPSSRNAWETETAKHIPSWIKHPVMRTNVDPVTHSIHSTISTFADTRNVSKPGLSTYSILKLCAV